MANRPVYDIYKTRLHVCALIGMGIPEYEAKRYQGRIKEGGILLSVHCDTSDWAKRAKELLKQTGAEDVSSAGEGAADFRKTDRPVRRAGESSSQTFCGGAPAFLAALRFGITFSYKTKRRTYVISGLGGSRSDCWVYRQ